MNVYIYICVYICVCIYVYEQVRVWDIKSRELVSHMKEHLDAVTCIKIFDDDAHALSGSKDRNIICWDLRHEKRVASLRQRMGGVNSLALYLDQVRICAYAHTCIVIRMQMYIYTHVHMHTCVRTHAYTYRVVLRWTNADSQWNLVYKASYRIRCCGNETIRR